MSKYDVIFSSNLQWDYLNPLSIATCVVFLIQKESSQLTYAVFHPQYLFTFGIEIKFSAMNTIQFLVCLCLSFAGVNTVKGSDYFTHPTHKGKIHSHSARHFIGERFGGGIVFYLDEKGQHGLIAASTDQNPGIPWYNGLTRLVGPLLDGLGAGAINTELIIKKLLPDDKNGYFAAKSCTDYTVTVGKTTYADWFLPSKFELDLLYHQKAKVGGFTNSNYWSCNEYQSNSVWTQNFGNGLQHISNSEAYANAVRAVRSF